MNGFENVCDDCPLRTKVDVTRARALGSWGSNGVRTELSDGNKHYEIVHVASEVCSSDTVQAVEEHTQKTIKECRDGNGPEPGVFRIKCGAKLASAWRWSEVLQQMQPNVNSSAEIIPLLTDADYRDAMPHFDEPTWLVGDPRSFSELDLGYRSSFANRTIKKLENEVRGTSAQLPKDKAIMLDTVSSGKFENVGRIRIAQGGPHFTFQIEADRETADDSTLLAEGIYKFLNSTPEDIEASEKLIEAIDEHDAEQERQMLKYLHSDEFSRDLRRAFGSSDDD